MDEIRLDESIKKAVTVEMERYALPDPEKTWQKIADAIALFDRVEQTRRKKRKTTAWLKAAAVFVAVVLTVGIIGFTQPGEATPFGWVLQGLQKITGDDYVLVRFNFGTDEAPEKLLPPPPPPDTEEPVTCQTNLIDISLRELLEIYPGVLYFPRSLAAEDLKTVQYLQAGDSWIIFLDFLAEGHNILLQQQDIRGQGTMSVAYGDDAQVSFHRLEGVEYMAALCRYGIVNVRWTAENKLFDLTGNLTVEEALAVAQSVAALPDP